MVVKVHWLVVFAINISEFSGGNGMTLHYQLTIAAVATMTPQTQINVWEELSYRLDVGRVTKDMNTCVFHYWQVSWETAVKQCADEDSSLLCYKTRKEMDDITEAFRLTAIGSAKLAIWLANRNCTGDRKKEKCLSLHIEKADNTVWHFFQTNCDVAYPYVCCVNGTTETTTSIEPITSSVNIASRTSDETDSSLITNTHTASSIRFPFCKKEKKRNVLWPNTDAGNVAVRPCPGNSIGEARWFCEHRNNGRWERSGPDLSKCRSIEVKNLKEQFNSSSTSDVISKLENIFRDHRKEVFGEDLADIISMMTELSDRMFNEMESLTSAAKWSSVKNGVDKVMSVIDRIVELEDTWQDIDKGKSVVGTNLLSTVEGMGTLLADSMPDDTSEQTIIGRNMALQILRPTPGESVFLPQWVATRSYSHRGRIVLENGYDKEIIRDEGNVTVVFALYSNMSSILSPAQENQGNDTSSLNSAVVSATITQKREAIKINHGVKIMVEHLTLYPNDSACVFWNMDRGQWDTGGCRLESSNETFSVCVCNHLTNFALLMDYRNALSDIDQDPFNYITVIGCSFSIICLSICVLIFSCYSHFSRHSWGVRYIIHRNLCLSLLIANLVLVCGLDRTENEKVCAFIAGLLHYFFLSAFSWMLLEGVHIYLLLVVVFASRKSHTEKYYFFGYGFPLVVVLITYIARPSYYGTDKICWLSTEKGTIWAFMGPVGVILILNTAALILAQYKASRISVKNDKAALIKRWLRVTLILFPVLGITWVFGFLYLGKHLEVAGYLFAIFNSFQGVCIFIFHCLLDKKARNMIVDSFKTKNSSIHTGSSGTQKKKEHAQNGVKSNSITPVESDLHLHSTGKENAFHLPKNKKSKRDWFRWRKPWSFCFEMPVSERSPQKDNSPQAVIVQWNSLKDKSVIT